MSTTEQSIRRAIWKWWKINRRDLPWRRTTDPYRVLVAEVMLQQTNVPKVVPKYNAFLKQFPTIKKLAAAPQSAVVTAWAGLGYNRRARHLHQLAQIVVRDYHGRIPMDAVALQQLPGIGPYMAQSIPIFAANAHTATFDVNIDRLWRRWYALPQDQQLAWRQRASASVPRGRSRDWHNALMDFASQVCTKKYPDCLHCPLAKMCKSYPSPNDQNTLIKKESGREENGKFIPNRIYRGRVIQLLRQQSPQDIKKLGSQCVADWQGSDWAWFEKIIAGLVRDQLIARDGQKIRLQ